MMNFFSNVYHGKTVLITGDTGFKGSWLAIWLLMLGAKVIGYSLEPKTEKDNYVVCGLSKRINHISGNINDYEKLQKVFTQYKPEFVFHLAAQAIVLESYETPLETFQTNVMGTVNVLEAIRKTPSVKAAIVVTSDKCYENKEWIFSYRENDPLGGKDPYSASKGAAELVTASYIQSFFTEDNSASVASVRAGNVIGGGDWATYRIIPDCIRSLLQNKPIIIRNPEAVRPWQHVLEPLSGYLLLGARLFSEGKKYFGPWNFGPLQKNMVTVKMLVSEVIKQWGAGEYQCEITATQKEANLLQLDITKAVNLLKWKPILDFEQTIDFTIDEYKSDTDIFTQRVNHIQKYMELSKNFEV